MNSSAPLILTLARRRGLITGAELRSVLMRQERDAIRRDPHRKSLQILCDEEKITATQRDDLLKEQSTLRGSREATRQYPGRRTRSVNPLVLKVVEMVAVAAIISLAPWELDQAIEVVTFVAGFLVLVASQFLSSRSISKVVLRALRTFIAMSIPISCLVLGVKLWGGGTRLERLSSIGLIISGLALFALAGCCIYLSRAKRFACARLGALKDMSNDIERRLRSTAELREHGDLENLRRVMRDLRAILELNAWDRVLRYVHPLMTSSVVTHMVYLEPDTEVLLTQSGDARSVDFHDGAVTSHSIQSGPHRLRVVASAYSPETPHKILDALAVLETDYRPVILNEKEYESLKENAKRSAGTDWKATLLDDPRRKDVISAVGWGYAKQQEMRSDDSRTCLAFDDSFYELAKLRCNLKDKELEWLRVLSFMVCPVSHGPGRCVGVLFAFKNVTSGFTAEDLECIMATRELILRLRSSSLRPGQSSPSAPEKDKCH